MLTLMMCMGPLLEIPGLTGVRNTALGFGAAAILVLAERLTSFPPSREFADPRMGNGPAQMEYYRTVVV
jgi:hypothetical protein